jgi:hypothetical protein
MPAVIDKKRKMLRRRGDMIICKITDEFGCAEAGFWDFNVLVSVI